jgi:hypothetical protein
MNTIEHDGQTYKVLTLDRISEITHAKLAGGLMEATPAPRWEHAIVIDGAIYTRQMQELNQIQPLRLVPREPVTFEADFALSGSSWYPLHHLSDGLAHQNSTTKRFRCVEIVEEAK